MKFIFYRCAILLLAIPFLFLITWSNYLLLLIILLLVLFSTMEFRNLIKKKNIILDYFFLIIILLFCFSVWFYKKIDGIFLGAAILSLLLESILYKEKKEVIFLAAFNILGFIYIGFTLSHIFLIAELKEGNLFIIFLFVVTWMTDVGASSIGGLFGRHKLAPNISERKTIEGTIGGVIAAVLSSLIFHFIYPTTFSLVKTLIGGFVLSIFAIIGDLFESCLKRGADVKDSGNIFITYGGILDIFDSIYFTAPIMYYLLINYLIHPCI